MRDRKGVISGPTTGVRSCQQNLTRYPAAQKVDLPVEDDRVLSSALPEVTGLRPGDPDARWGSKRGVLGPGRGRPVTGMRHRGWQPANDRLSWVCAFEGTLKVHSG
jgi:hypothetical protein